MGTFLIAATVILGAIFVMYKDWRTKIRGYLLALIILNIAALTMPTVGCAVELSPSTLTTFSLDVIKSQYEYCRLGKQIQDVLG